mmetsp:Transcript_15149/g.35874  ORF Transcript_15149/g.35874 Transcript_15149/m.35874 type:complete len:307 (+) Transcript_15149:39-959(+)
MKSPRVASTTSLPLGRRHTRHASRPGAGRGCRQHHTAHPHNHQAGSSSGDDRRLGLGRLGGLRGEARGLLCGDAAHLGRALLGAGVDVPEARQVALPVVEDGLGLGGAGGLEVLLDEATQLRGAEGVDALDVDVAVDARGQLVPLEEALVASDGVEEVAPAARLAGADVAPDGAERDDDAACHVLAAVVARALDDGLRVRVAHAEALARLAAEVGRARGGAVERDVAHDDVVHGREARGDARGQWLHGDLAAREALAAAVVGVAVHVEAHALHEREAEGLARVPRERHADGAVGQSSAAVLLRDLM